jgi:type IV secretion system protein TrbG
MTTRTKAVSSLTLGAAIVCGCAAQPPVPPPAPYVPAALVNPPPKPVTIPADPFAGLPESVREAIISGHPKPLRDGITMLFPYSPHSQPAISCQPLRVTEIVLNSDEKLVDNGVATGDTVRWSIAPVDNRVLVKPTDDGISTDLLVVTTKRSYHFTLRTRTPYVAQVMFYYPADILAAEAERNAALRKAAEQTAEPIPSMPLNFAYRISGPAYNWKPLQVFSDDSHMYVQLPENLAGADLPVLYVQDNNQHDSLVNYTVKQGNYLVTDRLFKNAVLTSGTGADRETVRIEAE